MRSKSNSFSVIIPTYTGEDFLKDCFDSILQQNDINKYSFEIVIVIDGPNQTLSDLVAEGKKEFAANKINCKVKQFKSNQGRFIARLEGAKLASGSQLLFIDDRNVLASDYFREIRKARKRALIPNVLEVNHPNFVAKTIYLARLKLYKGKWGTDFESFEIDSLNFEKSSKGTTSFWIDKNTFIEACRKIGKEQANLKQTNDDTKILKEIVNNYTPIYKSSEARIFYQPRQSVIEELIHFYHRGPRFIDYYLKPGTRFFVPIILAGVIPVSLLLLLIISPGLIPLVLIIMVVMLFLIAIYLTGFSLNVFLTAAGLVLIGASFSLGMVKGFLIKFRDG